MELYKKQIRPMISPPALQGIMWSPTPFYEDNELWFEADCEDVLRQKCEEKLEDPMSSIYFDVRFVKVEKPEVVITDTIKPDEIILIKFDTNKCDIDTISVYMSIYNEMFPKNTVVGLPDMMSLKAMDKEDILKFLDYTKAKIEMGELFDEEGDREL